MAKVKCRKCGVVVETYEAERIGGKWYCFSCLKEIAKEARSRYTYKLTPSLMVGVLVCIIMGGLFFMESKDITIGILWGLTQGTVLQFITYSNMLVFIPSILLTLLYIILGFSFMAGKRWSLVFCILLNLTVLIWEVNKIMSGYPEPLHRFLMFGGGSILLMITAILNRKVVG